VSIWRTSAYIVHIEISITSVFVCAAKRSNAIKHIFDDIHK